MKKKSDCFYDVQKMLYDDMKNLSDEATSRAETWENESRECADFEFETEKKLSVEEEWFRSTGIDVDYLKAKAEMSMVTYEENSRLAVSPVVPVPYDALVSIAHSRGFTGNTEKSLLTKEEIAVADNRLKSKEDEFSRLTRLKKEDLKFLFVAVGLQVIRQYLLNKFFSVRLSHEKSAEKAYSVQDYIWKTDEKNKNDVVAAKRKSRRYYASDSEIMSTYSVPFDAIKGTKTYGVGGEDKGLSGNSHRYNTLGHDPLFGWVFGTCNIMTNTLTNAGMQSFHVKNGEVVGNAATSVMLEEFITRSKSRPKDLGICMIKEALHLASDYRSKKGIPFPGIQNGLELKRLSF